jgi:glycosyltransferase involved in cell wall biosynthesis
VTAEQLLLIPSALLAAGWAWQAFVALRGLPKLPDLTRLELISSPTCSDLTAENGHPDLTVIVPACNEENAITATLTALLASSGVRLQIVAVDDRSTDSTGTLIDLVAAATSAKPGPHTLEVIRNRDLPPGWLGKPHALSLGLARARAPWLLFTDGDIRLDPNTAALALQYVTAEHADHLVLLFSLELKTAMEAAVFAVFQALASWNLHLWKVADPKSKAFFGAGGFNLVRREVLDQLGGMDPLRMEVAEDLRLGWMIKRAGFRQRVAVGQGLVKIRWIEGALGIVGLLEKNGFAGMRYRLDVALLAFFGLGVQIILPLAAIACGGWGAAAGLATYAFIGLAFVANRKVTQVAPWTAVLFAPATTVFLFALMRSVLLTLLRGGVAWRGTFYPLEELRRHAGRDWR